MPGVHKWYEGGAGGAHFAIENLRDKIARAEIASDEARKE